VPLVRPARPFIAISPFSTELVRHDHNRATTPSMSQEGLAKPWTGAMSVDSSCSCVSVDAGAGPRELGLPDAQVPPAALPRVTIISISISIIIILLLILILLILILLLSLCVQVLDRVSWGYLTLKYLLLPIHVSLSFVQTPTLGSALYLLLLRFLNRDYVDVQRYNQTRTVEIRYSGTENVYRSMSFRSHNTGTRLYQPAAQVDPCHAISHTSLRCVARPLVTRASPVILSPCHLLPGWWRAWARTRS
jgi:hypothetical protein